MRALRSFLTVFICLIATGAGAQPVALGMWRVHLPYGNTLKMCETPDRIYCAAENGLFAYIKSESSTERLSPAGGFGGYRVQAMAYDWDAGVLLLAYEGGKLELLRGRNIEKNDDIFRKTIVGEKKIHHIQISNGIAYIGTSFGLLELDLAKNEFRNSYLNIGPGGTVTEIFSSAVLNDSLFICTPNGIYKGSTNPAVNLADYTNWHLSKPALKASLHIASFNNSLYAELDSQLYRYETGGWQPYETGAARIITNISVNHGKLLIGAYGDSVFIVEQNGSKSYIPINILNQCLLDKDGGFWYCSPINGLVLKLPSGEEINFVPNGPRSVNAYQFLNAYGNLWVMAGSFLSTTYAPTFNGNKYYYFDNFSWTNARDNALTENLYDYTTASFQKSNGRLYIGTHGKGLLQMNNGAPFKVWDQSNSPLKPRGGLYTIVRGLASDNKNNLWVSNFDTDSALLMLSPSGQWSSFKLPVKNTGKIAIDNRGNKWIITPQSASGIVAFSDKNTATQSDDISVSLLTTTGKGNLPSSNVNDIAFTKSGELLIGTDQGYVRLRNPNNAFTGGDYDAQRVIVSVESNSNLGGYLLGSEVINCIYVDGGDRRWFGTNKGAWLYDSDGTTLLKHFTTENSPLMSDNVLSIGIMDATGEVFFGTDRGIASYRGDALPESKNMDQITIYPNPVKPDFSGDIAIAGMPDNTLVKITDINGALVHQTFSNGGMATWNGNSFDGQRVSTGVYLVFCINPDGSETKAGKILFIN